MLLDRLLAEARISHDREICGLLFGTSGRIEGAQGCANVAAMPERAFEVDPVALFAAHRGARGGGPKLIGHYHSHPSGIAAPSPRDTDGSMGDGALWLIIAGGDARLWRSETPGTFARVRLALC